jgi:UDP-N-acetylglucosamine 2-epimerase (non-hydrolysing)
MRNITILAGARPNFIKIAPIIRAIEKTHEASYLLVYAGRADDPALEPSLFSDLQMPAPTVFLDVDSSSLNEITSRVMAKFDVLLDQHPTDVVIVVDDLASTMAAAIVTKKRGLRLAHLVAGTRSFDMKMPKEVNRLVIDALSDYLFTAGVKSNSVASREQANADESTTGGTYMVGNILMDTLRFNHQRLRKPDVELEEQQYLVFTLNRKALMASPEHLNELLKAVCEAAEGTPVVAPLRGKALQMVTDFAAQHPQYTNIMPLPSLPYLQFGWLTTHARGIITDSGNVAEEATFNGVPCITLNSYTEHQETVTIGTNVLVGEDPQRLAEETKRMVNGNWKSGALPDRWDGRTAERIVRILLEG